MRWDDSNQLWQQVTMSGARLVTSASSPRRRRGWRWRRGWSRTGRGEDKQSWSGVSGQDQLKYFLKLENFQNWFCQYQISGRNARKDLDMAALQVYHISRCCKGAALLSVTKFLKRKSDDGNQTISREYQVWRNLLSACLTLPSLQIRGFNQTQTVTRNIDVTFCKVSCPCWCWTTNILVLGVGDPAGPGGCILRRDGDNSADTPR